MRRVGYPDRDTFLAALERTSGWLDSLPEATGTPIERTVLGGFSQGAVMAYALALGRGRPSPAGVIGLSGFLPTVDGFELDLDGRAGLPAFLAHGEYDPIIGVEFGRDAAGAARRPPDGGRLPRGADRTSDRSRLAPRPPRLARGRARRAG